MRRPFGFLTILLVIQPLAGCAWVNNDPIGMKLPGTTAQVTPCIANNLGKEFQDAVPVIEHGNTPGSAEITINAARGAMLGFVTVEPIASGGSAITFYDGQLYWPNRVTSGVWPDVARDNWHRAERAILLCGRDQASAA
ncbi:MAG TPA: hypothetical protein VEC60_21505 [Reyranella sp.]|nr:hypothetical protein [Reyranella sp.]